MRFLAAFALALLLAVPANAGDLPEFTGGAKHPTYTPDRFDRRSEGAGRNDALGKTREEMRQGNPYERRKLGEPETPKAWDTDGDGRLSEKEYQDGYIGRYKGDDPTPVDRGGFTIIQRD